MDKATVSWGDECEANQPPPPPPPPYDLFCREWQAILLSGDSEEVGDFVMSVHEEALLELPPRQLVVTHAVC